MRYIVILVATAIMFLSLLIYGHNRHVQEAETKMRLDCFSDVNTPACKGSAAEYVRVSSRF